MADRIIDLYNNLKIILVNELGKYKDTSGVEKPSIAIVPPQLPAEIKMINGSGLEVIINKTPQHEYKSQSGCEIKLVFTEIILYQHKLTDTTERAIDLIKREYFIHKKPEVLPQRQKDGDVELERAVIKLLDI